MFYIAITDPADAFAVFGKVECIKTSVVRQEQSYNVDVFDFQKQRLFHMTLTTWVTAFFPVREGTLLWDY